MLAASARLVAVVAVSALPVRSPVTSPSTAPLNRSAVSLLRAGLYFRSESVATF